MKFGKTPLESAEGAILAHSVKLAKGALKKGRVLSVEDVANLRAAGLSSVTTARLDADDIKEDEAAERLARALCGAGLTVAAPFTGRCNLVTDRPGLLLVEESRLDAINLVDESLTAATVSNYTAVDGNQMVATIKVIPFAAPRASLERCIAIAEDGPPIVRCQPFRELDVGLVQTTLAGTKPTVLDKTRDILDSRLRRLNSRIVAERRCRHDESEVADSVRALIEEGCHLVLVAGASAIVDRRDVVPAGIVLAGGEIDHFGMPVDPGNLLLLAHGGQVPILGLPGCARSPKFNGLDMVLDRLVAGIPMGRDDIMHLGKAGLLKDMPGRPQPRDRDASKASRAPRIAALVLAAGQSRRMGRLNKLLADVGGKPMIRRVVDTVAASRADPIVIVAGHQAQAIRETLDGLDLTFVENADYAQGLSTSLRAGIDALPDTVDGVLVCLGDMPKLTARQIDRLVSAFDPVEGRAICVPTYHGKRGNPVLWDRQFFADMAGLEGDVGARHLIGVHAELVCEVEMDDDGVLVDIDSPDALAGLTGGS